MSEQIIMKTCRVCKERKPLSEFPKHPTGKDGHRNHCKQCRSKHQHRYYINIGKSRQQTEEGKQASRKATQRFRQKHPLRVKAILTKQRQTEKYRIQQKRHQESEKFKAVCKLYRNSEAGRITQRKYRQNHREQCNAKAAVERSIKSGKLPRPDSLQCSCGKQAKQYHHHNGYDKKYWLDVVPLCVSCHGKVRKVF